MAAGENTGQAEKDLKVRRYALFAEAPGCTTIIGGAGNAGKTFPLQV